MIQAWIGLVVQISADSLTNNGYSKCPAIITSIGGVGPNGGLLVNLMIFPDGGSALSPYGAEDVELMEYEDYARPLGVGNGAWPMDVS